mmetsp:Transcript_33471/g.92499  ORF Transcript_33471/g.92499 Transcript_33471/m.92499 type:complete len:174 (+) Transcript_33471:121-642(+)
MKGLPRVKNKEVNPQQISVVDLLGPRHQHVRRGGATAALLASADAAGAFSSTVPAPLTQAERRAAREEDDADVAQFRKERASVKSRVAIGTGHALLCPKKPKCSVPGGLAPPRQGQHAVRGARAMLQVRRGCDWQRRRLLLLAIMKGDPASCPLARLPQGFAHAFAGAVLRFL